MREADDLGCEGVDCSRIDVSDQLDHLGNYVLGRGIAVDKGAAAVYAEVGERERGEWEGGEQDEEEGEAVEENEQHNWASGSGNRCGGGEIGGEQCGA